MAPTPETLTRHELRGLPVRVVAAASDAHVGLAGVVVSESMRTLTVRASGVTNGCRRRGRRSRSSSPRRNRETAWAAVTPSP
nr:ribonuclease P protein subunit [Halobaculum sp. DT92]